jgi:hypothetical protein
MLHLHKRYGIYRVRGRVNGRNVDQSLDTRIYSVAESLMRRTEKDLVLNRSQERWGTFAENF